MTPTWDPTQYARYADHRARPFHELLARVGAVAPGLVVDLGCGNGPLTLSVADRWPDARVVGVDSSADMLAAAGSNDAAERVEWVHADLTTWPIESLGARPDVIVCNATLQWLPDQLDLLRTWVEALAPGGWLAFQVPGNLYAPSHALMRTVARQHPRSVELGAALDRFWLEEPGDYLAALLGAAGESGPPTADVWETTYLQVLPGAPEGEHPVLSWVRGTGLRPVLDLLTDEAERAEFMTPYAAAVTAAYPRTGDGVVYPFRRIFGVVQVAGAAPADGAAVRVLGLDHVQVACPVGSEDVLRSFYAGVLGMPEVPKPPALAVRGGVWFQAGDQQIHCGVEEGFAPARKAHPCFVVTDASAVADAVAGAGGQVRWDESIPGIRRFHTADPMGYRLEVMQRQTGR